MPPLAEGGTYFSSTKILSDLLIKTLERIRLSSNQKIGEGESHFDGKYIEKVFNRSEVHISEMTCYKIHTLVIILKILSRHVSLFRCKAYIYIIA